MNQNQSQNQNQKDRGDRRRAGRPPLLRVVAPVATALILLGLTAGPSSARPDAGDSVRRHGEVGQCRLERVGAQFVRCDFLTGNGVPAPAWIPER